MLTIVVRSVFEEDGKYYPQGVFRQMFVMSYKNGTVLKN